MSDSDKLTFYFPPIPVVVVGGVSLPIIFWNVPDAPPVGFNAGLSALLLTVAVKVPSGNPTFDWVIADSDGFPQAQRAGVQGSTTTAETAPIYPLGTVQIQNATIDGTYLVKIYAKQAH